jgi:hypothetical protein
LEAVSACGQVIAHQLEAAAKALRAAEILLVRVQELTGQSEQR